jgi:hypothetical protein
MKEYDREDPYAIFPLSSTGPKAQYCAFPVKAKRTVFHIILVVWQPPVWQLGPSHFPFGGSYAPLVLASTNNSKGSVLAIKGGPPQFLLTPSLRQPSSFASIKGSLMSRNPSERREPAGMLPPAAAQVVALLQTDGPFG